MERLVVLGAGESGVGTAILGKQKGFDVFVSDGGKVKEEYKNCLLYTSPSPRDRTRSRMPSSA